MSKFHTHILNSLAYTFLQKGKRENLKFIDKLIKEKNQDLKEQKNSKYWNLLDQRSLVFCS